jgi:hypothetical protein
MQIYRNNIDNKLYHIHDIPTSGGGWWATSLEDNTICFAGDTSDEVLQTFTEVNLELKPDNSVVVDTIPQQIIDVAMDNDALRTINIYTTLEIKRNFLAKMIDEYANNRSKIDVIAERSIMYDEIKALKETIENWKAKVIIYCVLVGMGLTIHPVLGVLCLITVGVVVKADKLIPPKKSVKA